MTFSDEREILRNRLLDRIQRRREAIGLSELQASLKAAGKRDTIRNIRRRNLPSIDKVERIARALQTSVGYLVGETDDPAARAPVIALAEGAATFEPAAARMIAFEADEYVAVPRYEMSAAAGRGIDLPGQPAVRDRLLFRAEWLRRATASPIARLAALDIVGDSMEPTLKDGDTVLIDLDAADPARRAGVYAINEDGVLRVKRLEPAGPSVLALISDNRAYPPDRRSRDEIDVVGRAVWVGRQM